jgi:hypothetical protein
VSNSQTVYSGPAERMALIVAIAIGIWCMGGPKVELSEPAHLLGAFVSRVLSREYGVRLKSKVSAEYFRRLLAGRGFDIEGPATGSGFTARRK